MNGDFRVGDRVMVSGWRQTTSDWRMGMNGYYGHVTKVVLRTGSRRTLVEVALSGRIGAPARPKDLGGPDDPWPFYSNELEHAD